MDRKYLNKLKTTVSTSLANRLVAQVVTGVFALGVFGLTACQPKVTIEAPDKPITVNLNVKLEHEIRIRVEKDVENLIKSDSEIF